MPEPAELSPRPYDAVLFDFHGTLAQVEDPVTWVTGAAAACGHTLDRGRATGLADRFTTAGRAGGPVPERIPPHLAEYWADRDLDPHAHRAAYTGLAATVECGIDGLPEALYARLLDTACWHPYPDTGATLRALRAAGIAVGVVSNIGFDIRPHLGAWGLADLVDAWTLSYEVGRLKPDPAIFYRAVGALRVDPERTLMIGDSLVDAGAAAVGCTAVVLPATPVSARQLAAVPRMTGLVSGDW
nr:HAD-IA family hydrolase [Pilimelia terevasa]